MKKKTAKFNTSLFSYERFSIALIWIGVFFITTFFVLLLLDAMVFHWLSADQDAKLGNMGQLLEGTVGSLWALAGVILVYEALRFQRMELKSQRHEFELNRQEIIEQTQQFKAQNQTLFLQKFENTFFQMINLHNEIVAAITIEAPTPVHPQGYKKTLLGRKCFNEFYHIFKNIYYDNIDNTGIGNPEKSDMLELLNESYLQFYNKHQDDLGHYLRNISNTISFIDKSEVKNKDFYTRLLQDHMTNFELLILFYHCISDVGMELKPYIEKYSFFENLVIEEVLDRRHIDFYETYTFKSPK